MYELRSSVSSVGAKVGSSGVVLIGSFVDVSVGLSVGKEIVVGSVLVVSATVVSREVDFSVKDVVDEKVEVGSVDSVLVGATVVSSEVDFSVEDVVDANVDVTSVDSVLVGVDEDVSD